MCGTWDAKASEVEVGGEFIFMGDKYVVVKNTTDELIARRIAQLKEDAFAGLIELPLSEEDEFEGEFNRDAMVMADE